MVYYTIMLLLEKTPRDLLENQFVSKSKEGKSTSNHIDFPLDHSQFSPIGSGDWGHYKSTCGSVIEGNNKYVCKYPQGLLNSRYSFDDFRFCVELIKAHEFVSPETTVVVCDSDQGLLPLILQRKISGRPVCEVPLNQLLNVHTLNSLLEIQKNALDVFIKTHCVDLCGTRFNFGLMSKLANILPIFGDNIIVDQQGECILVDNLPNLQCRPGKDRFKYCLIESGLRAGIVINNLTQIFCNLFQPGFLRKNKSLSQNQ